MSDITEITQVILRERQARDRGWWDQMRKGMDPEAEIRLSWFRGNGSDFVEASQQMQSRGQQATHRLSPPVISVHGTRALVELPAAIEFRDTICGIEADLTSYTRLIYCLEKDSGTWKIKSLDPIYERDILVPTIPGEVPQIDREALAGLRKPYRFLGYYLLQTGYSISDDLYGDDRPDEVEKLYRSSFEWVKEDVALA